MTIGYTKVQRLTLVLGLVVLVVLAFTVGAPGGAVIGAIVGIVFVLGNEVRLQPPGVEMKVGFRTIRVPWGDIARVERAKRFGTDRVALRLHDGKTKWLPLPYSGWLIKNPELDAQATAVEAAWRAGYAQQHGPLPT